MAKSNMKAVDTVAVILSNVDKATMATSQEAILAIHKSIRTIAGNQFVTTDLELLASARTKNATKVLIEKIHDAMINAKANKAQAEKKAQEDKASKQAEHADKMSALADDIKNQIGKAQASYLKVGELLTTAKDDILANDGKQADFLAWAKSACNLSKSQAYKLISVYKNFGQDRDFTSCSMRVLFTLTSANEKVVEQARALAVKRKLDSKALAKIVQANEPVKSTPATNSTPASPEEKSLAITEAEKLGGKVAESGQSTPADKSTPATKATPANAPNIVHAMDAKQINELAENATTKALQATIEQLNATVASLQEDLKLARGTRVREAANMPELLQFDSKEPCTVLGLESSACGDKVRINKAYRSLAKIYTAGNAPVAADKLKIAREVLLQAIA